MRNGLLVTIIVLFAAGCTEQETKTANRFQAKDGKLCSANNTGDTLHFVLSEKDNGKMRDKITPGSRFCTSDFVNAKLTVNIEKRGAEYCQTQAKQGVLYTLTKLNTDGPCAWVRS